MTFRGCLCLALMGLGVPALGQSTGTLEGRWLLSEQYYGEGRQNYALRGEPLELVFSRGEKGWQGKILVGGRTLEWPSWNEPSGPLPLLDLEKEQSENGRAIAARFRVPQSPGEGVFLKVHENCRLRPDDYLACDVEVVFEVNGKADGGFTWHRVFVREARP